MHRPLLRSALALACLLGLAPTYAANYTYHGTLSDKGQPANGSFDIRLTLFREASGGESLGQPITLYGVAVKDGGFSAAVDLADATALEQRAWIEVAVKAGDTFLPLAGRSPIAPAGGCPGAWTLDGNSGNPVGSFLGTADNQAVEVRANNRRVLRLEPYVDMNIGDAPNVVAGSSVNSAGAAIGATVSGGGYSVQMGSPCAICGNAATGNFSAIGGGSNNVASEPGATVGGGQGNAAIGQQATVGGGGSNVAGGIYAHVAGGTLNQASGDFASVPGGRDNRADGQFSFAAGQQARVGAMHSGTFVWADAQDETYSSSSSNQFLVRADNGVAVNTTPLAFDAELTIGARGNDIQTDLVLQSGQGDAIKLSADGGVMGGNDSNFIVAQVNNAAAFVERLRVASNGDLTVSAAAFKPGGGSWSPTSDRRIKQDIVPIGDALSTVLKLKPVQFHYTPEYRAMEGGLADKAYLGFIAQDFAEVFPEAVVSTGRLLPGADKSAAPILALDPNPALITTVAAVQELAIAQDGDASRLAALESDNALLRRKLDALLARMAKLEGQRGE